MGVKMKLIGGRRVARKFERLSDVAQKRVARPAVKKAMVPVNKTAKKLVAVESKTLKKSIAIGKVKTYKSSGAVVVLVGPKSGFERNIDGETRKPVKYAHLVEFGTINTRARPFLRPALKNNKAEVERIFASEISVQIAKEFARA